MRFRTAPFTIALSASIFEGSAKTCRESSLAAPVRAPVGNLALAGQHRQGLADFERRLFTCKKLELAIDGIRPCSLAASTIIPVALQMMSFLFVGQLKVKNVLQAMQ